MGMAKDQWMREQERGFGSVLKHICSECLTDASLRQLADDSATECECDYCGRLSQEPIAAPFDIIGEAIMHSIWSEWSTPERAAYVWDNETKSYYGAVYEAVELFEMIGFPSENADFIDDFIGALNEPLFCEPDFASPSPAEALIYSWENFVEVIKHRRRYMFSHELEAREPTEHAVEPHQFLEFLGEAMLEHGAVRTLEVGAQVFRTRVVAPGAVLDSAEELGSPPPEKAPSGRMSAAGISVFYGAMDIETCVAEVLATRDDGTYQVANASFSPVRPLRILDLTHLPDVPSLYDDSSRHLRPAIKFLRAFIADVSQPAKPGTHIDVHYAPTQVVAEYARYVLKDENGGFDGIAYRSAQHAGGTCIVLFVENKDCVGEVVPRWVVDPKLRLIVANASNVNWNRPPMAGSAFDEVG